MKTVYYTGPYSEGVEITLPGGGSVLAEPGEPIETTDEHAESLLEQEDIWSTTPAGAPSTPPPAKSTVELAERLDVDLSKVEGTGNKGLIKRADVEAAAAPAGTPSAPEQASGEENQPKSGATEEE